jgi:hypothetical protein
LLFYYLSQSSLEISQLILGSYLIHMRILFYWSEKVLVYFRFYWMYSHPHASKCTALGKTCNFCRKMNHFANCKYADLNVVDRTQAITQESIILATNSSFYKSYKSFLVLYTYLHEETHLHSFYSLYFSLVQILIVSADIAGYYIAFGLIVVDRTQAITQESIILATMKLK